jgi:ferric-dicitrate binding protein FerR (iron transport regulator)
MEKEFYIDLIYKSFSGDLSTEKQNQLDNWLSESEANRKEFDVLKKTWEMSSNFSKDFEVNLDTEFAQLQNRIDADEKGNVKEAIVKTIPVARKNNWWKPLSVAAAVLLLAGAFFVFNQNSTPVEMLAMKTLDGEVKEVALADGSKVWLNENSLLSYPDAMNGDERRVTLKGEAFFDITKNPSKPFIIDTRDAEVKVLGTSFEVRAMDDETKTEVVVKTGKVSLGKKNEVKPLILTKNQKGVYNNKTQGYVKSEVKDLNSISWQSKTMEFNDVVLEKVLTDIENHFDIKVTLDNQDLLKCKFTSIFIDKDQDAVLKTISNVLKMKLVETNDKSYRLTGGECRNTGE